MNRVVAGVVGLAVGAAVLVGCSDDKPAAAPSSGNGNTQVSTSGSTEVKVGGEAVLVARGEFLAVPPSGAEPAHAGR